MNEKYLVTKSNFFIMNSSYDLSLEEQRIILTLASMVQPDDEDFKPYQFRIEDFIDMLGVNDKSKYTEVPKITKGLMKKVFEIHEGKKIIQVAWLCGAEYEKNTGMVKLEFSPMLKPYMLKLKDMFTQYRLENVLSLKSKYSIRVYEILKANEFRKQGYVEITIEEARKLFKTENLYTLYSDFKRKVIIQAQIELKEKTDINFEFEEIKTGRKVTSIRFYIKNNNKKVANIIKDVKKADYIKEEDTSLKSIRERIKYITGHNLTLKSVESIYKLALENEHYSNPITLIEDLAQYSITQNINNFAGWFRTVVKDFKIDDEQHINAKSFNNFKPREVDYEELQEKSLEFYRGNSEENSNVLQEWLDSRNKL